MCPLFNFQKKQLCDCSKEELGKQLQDLISQKNQIENNIVEIMSLLAPDEGVHDVNDEKAEEGVDKPKTESDSSDETINRLQSKISELNEEISRLNKELDTVDGKMPDTALSDEIHKLSLMISERNEIVKENEYLLKKLEEKQERLEQIIHNCQEDRYRKDKGRLINRIIYQMDLVRNVIYDFDNEPHEDISASVAFLRQQFLEIITYMEATLRAESVECIRLGDEGSSLDLELQEVTDVVLTDNPELNGKVYRSVHPGYTWKLPYILKAKIKDDGSVVKDYDFLIRPEQVITYKLNK